MQLIRTSFFCFNEAASERGGERSGFLSGMTCTAGFNEAASERGGEPAGGSASLGTTPGLQRSRL